MSNVVRIHSTLLVANQPYQAIGKKRHGLKLTFGRLMVVCFVTLYIGFTSMSILYTLHSLHRLATCNDHIGSLCSHVLPAAHKQTWQTMMQLSRPCTTRSSRPQEAWTQEPQLLLHFFARLPDNSFKLKMFPKFDTGSSNQSTSQPTNPPTQPRTQPTQPTQPTHPPIPCTYVLGPTPAPPHTSWPHPQPQSSQSTQPHVIGPIPPKATPPLCVDAKLCVLRQHATRSFVYK